MRTNGGKKKDPQRGKDQLRMPVIKHSQNPRLGRSHDRGENRWMLSCEMVMLSDSFLSMYTEVELCHPQPWSEKLLIVLGVSDAQASNCSGIEEEWLSGQP